MTSIATQPTLAERGDIHKSCKSLEVVVNLLNDYCEAAGAVVQLQKKLAKAVRDASSSKITPEHAANTFSACATLLEVLSDVDNKFAKVADKECEGLSTEVRKWFKKLAKEEKAHDDRLAQASAKIKQAGLSYEKKAKKNAREAAEEHSRYLSLVGTLGPEMTQDKYNHAVFVSHKHSTTTMNVAACLARIADAEWLRSCENVRRFAPTVGRLGESRAYCEGGWTGPRPPNLLGENGFREPSFEQRQLDRPSSRADNRPASRAETLMTGSGASHEFTRSISRQTTLEPDTPMEHPKSSPLASPQISRQPSPAQAEEAVVPASPSEDVASPVVATPPEPESPRRTRRTSTSLASLAAFPSPPTHFPIPAVSTPSGNKPSASLSGQSAPGSGSDNAEAAARSPRVGQRTPTVSFAALPSLSESPRRDASAETAPASASNGKAHPAGYPFPNASTPTEEPGQPQTTPPLAFEELHITPKDKQASLSKESPRELTSPAEPLSPSDTGTTTKGSSASGSQSGHGLRRGDYMNEREFGVERPAFGQGSRSMDAIKSRGVQRNESMQSNGSLVAAMRGKYVHSTSPASPPPRDIPKLSQSVTEIAGKYRAPEIASPQPLRRTMSPPVDMPPAVAHAPSSYRLPDSHVDPGSRPSLSASTSSRTDLTSSSSSINDEYARRRQRLEELEELEYREREYELRQKEREIEQRSRDLEREKARLAHARAGPTLDGYTSDSGSGRPRADPSSPVAGLSRGRFASSATHVALPSASSRAPSVGTPANGPTEHAAYCGCATCSATKYSRQDRRPSAHDLRPPEAPINLRPQPEKPKGWMRRLSMPVGAAFSLNDSKKNASPGLNRNSMSFVQEEDDRGARRDFDPKSPGNRSTTNFTRR